MNSWYELLNGNITYNTQPVNVYRTDVFVTEDNHHIIIRVESRTNDNNNRRFVDQPVIITEVVTKFRAAIDDGVAGEIDEQIERLLYQSTPGLHSLPPQDDIVITAVNRQNATYLPEDDGTFRYNRLITRNVHRVVRLLEAS